MIQIILIALLPLAMAQYGGHGIGYGGHGGGYGHASYEHYAPQPYKFGYDVKDGHGSGLNQKEEGDAHGNKVGSYGYTDGYGIYRQVDYVADAHGFRATVKTNEPGTANQNPADVHINSHAAPAAHAGSLYKAPSHGYASYAPAHGGYGLSLGHGGYGSGLSLGHGASYGHGPVLAQSHSYISHAAPVLSHGYGGHSVHRGY